MKKRVIPIVLVLVAAGAVVAWQVLEKEERERTELVLHGNVDIREVSAAFRVAGRLQDLSVEEGDRVTAGQVLGHLDVGPFQEELAARTAEVARASAVLAKLEAGPRPGEIEEARAAVRGAEATAKRAELDLARQKDLLEPGGSSVKAVEAAQGFFDESDARLAAAREALGLLEEGYRTEEVEAARAALAAAKAQRDLAETHLEDATLLAPSDATVLVRAREPGSILAAGTPVLTLSLRDPVYVRAYVTEPDLGHVPPGTRVTLTTDSSGDRRYEGRVGFVSPRAEFTPKSVETESLRTDLVYRLRIVALDSDDALLQGMPVTVTVPLAGN